jgi:hypothetical protein
LSLVAALYLQAAGAPALALQISCVGDCNGSGDVTADELITGVKPHANRNRHGARAYLQTHL